MATQFEVISQKLREMLMRGDFESGQHLQEIPLAKQLNASRTPVRLALGALAQEGLLIYKPQRGFLVREFSIKEITDAVKVRGELEAMAARLVAENGISEAGQQRIVEILEESKSLNSARETIEDYATRWFALNEAFHEAIVEEAGNSILSEMIGQINNVPLAGSMVLTVNAEIAEIVKAGADQNQREHEVIFCAILRRQSQRACANMQEHVYKGADLISNYLNRIRTQNRDMPLLKLVARD
ncbi:GntR family transcriptional regulator [Pseudoruegeria sp. HB172150]|uniref:GntR family transcriptional regulator n=1 Tax=Pseudoruegeria sp. HB172150 TaxID=2721164 RepID=UPI00210F5466|nr:GntR family transcriptional regulator [Pseudoruegeria sp. HB172150]